MYMYVYMCMCMCIVCICVYVYGTIRTLRGKYIRTAHGSKKKIIEIMGDPDENWQSKSYVKRHKKGLN